eukprot:COSAG01_NODE_3026_length_6693_cov_4.993036_5_plen_117_part_00
MLACCCLVLVDERTVLLCGRESHATDDWPLRGGARSAAACAVLLGGATVTIDTKSRFITISLPDVATTRTFRCPGLGALNDWSADIMKLTTEEELFTVARTLLVSALSTLTLCQTI